MLEIHSRHDSVRDLDLLTAGALRREAFSSRGETLVLEIFPMLVPPERKDFYRHALQELESWLRPVEVREASLGIPATEFLQESLWQDFQKYFPKTTQQLGEKCRIFLQTYTEEFPWQGGLLTEHFRYFPTWLRQQGLPARKAQREWLWAFLGFADFGEPRGDLQQILLNPSLQILAWDQKDDLAEGLYALAYVSAQKKIVEEKLDVAGATLLDLLQEDRKYSVEQLLGQALLQVDVFPSREEWLKKLFYLQALGIIELPKAERLLNSSETRSQQ